MMVGRGIEMTKCRLSQEQLKIIACGAMLIDHFAAVLLFKLFPMSNFLLDLYEILRIIGRLAFPIFCFLIAEGAYHTRDSQKYALRMAIGAVLSELPYDLAFYGRWTLEHQSTMVTLLLGYGVLVCMKRCPLLWQKLLVSIPFSLVAELLHTDYGARGVLLVTLFALTRDAPRKRIFQALGMWFLFSDNHAMLINWIQRIYEMGTLHLSIQEWATLSVFPISLYSGKKQSRTKALQSVFYLFYPAHLLVLYLLKII